MIYILLFFLGIDLRNKRKIIISYILLYLGFMVKCGFIWFSCIGVGKWILCVNCVS